MIDQIIAVSVILIAGIVGTGVRWAVQYYRGGGHPTTLINAGVEVVIGAAAAYLGLALLGLAGVSFPDGTPEHIVAILLGFMGVDVIENIFKGYNKPTTPPIA